MKLQVIIEKGNDVLYGRIEGSRLFTPTTSADTKKEVLSNLKMLIKDYQENEGAEDNYWNKVDVDTVEFELLFDLQSFFEEFDWITASAIARHAGMNESLVRQYAAGKKFPSLEQAKKIQAVIRELSKPLQKLSIHA
jgi:hypothetical protein